MADPPSDGAAALPAAGGSRRAVFVLLLICAAQFVLQLDFSIVNVALPSIQRELGMPAAELQWIVTGYGLAFGSLLLAGRGGRAGRDRGRGAANPVLRPGGGVPDHPAPHRHHARPGPAAAGREAVRW